MVERLFLFTDGASRGNPGPAGAGVVLKNQEGKVLMERSQFLGRMTNNEAEYRALILGLVSAEKFRPKTLVCLLDSELVASQLKGVYKIRKPHLGVLVQEARRAESAFAKVIYKVIPREKNEQADRLANEALQRR